MFGSMAITSDANTIVAGASTNPSAFYVFKNNGGNLLNIFDGKTEYNTYNAEQSDTLQLQTAREGIHFQNGW